MERGLVTLGIFIAFYILAGYSTTDILRLVRGAVADIDAPSCFCPVCGAKIRLIDQVPILSYCLSGGRCRSCQCKIPPDELRLECAIFGLLSVTAACLHFSPAGFWLCLFGYEAVKSGYIIVCGRRAERFWRNLAASLRNNLVIWGLIAVLFGLRSIV